MLRTSRFQLQKHPEISSSNSLKPVVRSSIRPPVRPSVHPSIRPAKSPLGPKGPSTSQVLERSPRSFFFVVLYKDIQGTSEVNR